MAFEVFVIQQMLAKTLVVSYAVSCTQMLTITTVVYSQIDTIINWLVLFVRRICGGGNVLSKWRVGRDSIRLANHGIDQANRDQYAQSNPKEGLHVEGNHFQRGLCGKKVLAASSSLEMT